MRLFHFSDDATIEEFQPRPVRVPGKRAPGCEWLNGPLVWAIDNDHQPLYLFPRACPRILLWCTPQTTPRDKEKWWRGSSARMIAYIEDAWLERVSDAILYRYEFTDEAFENLHDAGMWVSRHPVRPIERTRIENLPRLLKEQGVELRVHRTLAHLRDVWATSLHASGIRLRNAQGWAEAE